MVISIKTKETVVCNVNIQNTKIQVTQVAVPVLPIPFPTICKMDNICIPAVCELKRMDSSQGYLGGGGSHLFVQKWQRNAEMFSVMCKSLILLVYNSFVSATIYDRYSLFS